MVVLDSKGMLTSAGNQYLQPDYLSPLPTTLDAKKSPLALLAQTCSQIGADSPATSKALLEKPRKEQPPGSASGGATAERAPSAKSEKRSPPLIASTATEITRSTPKLAFKPYENIPVSRPTPDSDSGKKSPSSKSRKSPSSRSSSSNKDKDGASPIIRSGLELLQGTTKEPLGSPYKSLPVNPYLEGNPAFRNPLAGFPPGMSYGPPPPGMYRKDVCKDPYCQGCQLSAHNAQLLAAVAASAPAACPPGCTQCEHHKYGLAAALSLMPPHLAAMYSHQGAAAAAAAAGQRPYVCSWIVGDAYCGKRFGSSEELLQHLRSHTSAELLSPHLMRYPNPPLSPLSAAAAAAAAAAARYHPYAKPGGMPGSPFSAFNPPPHLAAYYPPFSFYGPPRVGAPAVHP